MLFHMHRRLGRLRTAARRGADRQPLKLSIKEYMKGLRALGIVILDDSVAGKIWHKGRVPIETDRGPSHSSDKCVLDILTIAEQFFVLQDSQRAESWVKTALFVEDIASGGCPEMFALRYQDVLVRQEWFDFVHRVLHAEVMTILSLHVRK
ncbi:hypothetical protein BD410DRAFT_866616 [Rickenella mellea]|uniref:Uncharacterized protein n=1 Tax=Rickenella mellea TaxID=50990 RepID=A0A4Y7Q2V8_9AGAM|nr:hypothetical protein BD410DRAFT_866616 [Rickenella mellea]